MVELWEATVWHARINQLHKDRPSYGQLMIGSFHGIAVYRARVYTRAARRRYQRLFGGARFYEEYQVKSLVFGKYQTGPAYRSQIIDYTPNVDIDTMPVMIETVNGIAQANPDRKIILMGCGDNYVALAAQAQDAGQLASNVIAPMRPTACSSSARRRRSSTSCARSTVCPIRTRLPLPCDAQRPGRGFRRGARPDRLSLPDDSEAL